VMVVAQGGRGGAEEEQALTQARCAAYYEALGAGGSAAARAALVSLVGSVCALGAAGAEQSKEELHRAPG
jgi:hypothetical protein